MSNKYFPNNWRLVKNAPDEAFSTCTYEELEEGMLRGWEIPGNVEFIFRVYNKREHKVKEYVYQQRHAALARLEKLVGDASNDITICTHEVLHSIQFDPDHDSN